MQPEFSERLAKRDNGGFPIHAPGDLVYETELGQSNYYHLFGIDLNDHMKAITGTRQHWWVEGIRYPDDDFGYREAERANYRRVLKANEDKRDRRWDEADFREFHMVAAFRSPHDPRKREVSEAGAAFASGGNGPRPTSACRRLRAGSTAPGQT